MEKKQQQVKTNEQKNSIKTHTRFCEINGQHFVLGRISIGFEEKQCAYTTHTRSETKTERERETEREYTFISEIVVLRFEIVNEFDHVQRIWLVQINTNQ